MRRVLSVALCIGCGGRVGPSGGDATGSPDSGGTSGSEIIGEAGAGGSTDPGRPCDVIGAKRAASPSEMTQYCVCTLAGQVLLWRCYGPAPNAPRPQATCKNLLSVSGTGNGSCFVSWSNCSDSKDYSISCVSGDCNCLVQAQPTAFLEPRDTCPESKADFNMLCGWNLQ
jgi:hypothetical protein